MKNDKGCLCCLPSEIAPILFGIFNVSMLVLWGIAGVWLFALPAVIGLVPVVWAFFDRKSACARLVLLIVFVAESVFTLFYAWVIVGIANSESCYHHTEQCEQS